MTVSELARRCGVPASTVRYYDDRGLLSARRSSSGYRLYDDSATDRLAFIGTAKTLGLPLSEIRRLLEPWQHGLCADVQDQLAPLLDRRVAETHERIAELRLFADRLARAREQLADIDREGPCDPSCTFLGRDRPAAPPMTLASIRQAPATEPDEIACTLGASERADRAAAWGAVLAGVAGRTSIPGGVRLTFDPDRADIGRLAELAASEADCCRFFDLTLHLGRPPTLDARAPDDALVLVHELFGEPAP